MQFNSIDFMIFFPVVLVIYFLIGKRFRSIWLLLASYYFYMSWNKTYALLIAFSTLVTYACAIGIEKYRSNANKQIQINSNIQKQTSDKNDLEKRAKVILGAGLFVNLIILFVFKYLNFGIGLTNGVLGRIGLPTFDSHINLLLPVGISFYTFQALGYVIDVYRGDVRAEKNIIRYALFVSFFPQLVAGPIERSKNLLCQIDEIENIKLWNAKRVTSGAILMLWGFFMKMVIADRIAIIADTVFNNYRLYGATELIAGAIAFTIQIYCDFGSYSLIAIGAAKIMGFSLMENFNTPYFATSIRDFWSRWHISLSTWFKDYLYIPLGGNRKGNKRKYLNTMIVFGVSGLWHGAGLNYVFWGLLHGIYQVFADIVRPFRTKVEEKYVKTDCFSFRFTNIIGTFVLTSFAWIFFRAGSIRVAFGYVRRIFTRFNPWILFNDGLYEIGLDRTQMNILVFSVVVLLLVDLVRYLKRETIDTFLMRQNIWFEWGVIIFLVVFIFIFGEYGPSFDPKQFIYFQF